MDPWLWAALLWAGAYLVGAIPFGYLVARSRGVDIFQAGSGNIGATNVGRVLGRRFGILVFLLDFAKGAVPVLAAMPLAAAQDSALASDFLQRGGLEVGAGLAAFLGHLFPIYLRFRGGKAVATGAGVVAVLLPIPTLAAALTWLTVVSATRMVSLGSLAAALVLCLVHVAQKGEADLAEPRTLLCIVAVALVFVRHVRNIGRILKGTENRLPEGGTMQRLAGVLHVLALGLWFGTGVFFTFVMAPSLFQTFEQLGKSDQREPWFPLTPEFARADDVINGPREQGARAAGYAVGPLFRWYFLIQGACGFVAVITSMSVDKGNRRRQTLLIAALVIVVIGWPLEQYVSGLRPERNAATSVYLQSGPAHKAEALERMKAARGAFGMWHTASLFLNFGTVILVAIALAGAARPSADRFAQAGPLSKSKSAES